MNHGVRNKKYSRRYQILPRKMWPASLMWLLSSLNILSVDDPSYEVRDDFISLYRWLYKLWIAYCNCLPVDRLNFETVFLNDNPFPKPCGVLLFIQVTDHVETISNPGESLKMLSKEFEWKLVFYCEALITQIRWHPRVVPLSGDLFKAFHWLNSPCMPSWNVLLYLLHAHVCGQWNAL